MVNRKRLEELCDELNGLLKTEQLVLFYDDGKTKTPLIVPNAVVLNGESIQVSYIDVTEDELLLRMTQGHGKNNLM